VLSEFPFFNLFPFAILLQGEAALPKNDLNVPSVYFINDEAKLKSIFCAFMIYLAA